MTALPGRWALIMSTPVGRISAEMTFTEGGDVGGAFVGTAASKSETVPLRDIISVADGDTEHVTWSQAITKPMRLNLNFDVTIRGDEMNGFSRAGRLPRSTVIGRRLQI